MDMHTFEEIIQFAMRHEEAEADFYEDLAARSQGADQKKALLAQAEQEREHKRKLEEILADQNLPRGRSRNYKAAADLKLADYIEAKSPEANPIDYADALLLAVKMERAAEQLYREMAEEMSNFNSGLSRTLTFLADQEAKHAGVLEGEFDDSIKEN